VDIHTRSDVLTAMSINTQSSETWQPVVQ